MSEDLPKKISFFDKLKYVFGRQSNIDRIIQENADLKEQLESNQIQGLEDKLAFKKKLEIERDKTRDSQKLSKSPEQLTDYLREQVILEKNKLTAALKQMDETGIPAQEQLKEIDKYQSKVLGMLYAYTEFDTQSNQETKKTIQNLIQENVMELGEDTNKSFIDGFMHTRYSSCYYDDRDWEKYVDNNPFFKGGELRTPETDKRTISGYYVVREDFSTVGEKLYPYSNIDKLHEIRKENRGKDKVNVPEFNVNSQDLTNEVKENAGYGVEDLFER